MLRVRKWRSVVQLEDDYSSGEEDCYGKVLGGHLGNGRKTRKHGGEMSKMTAKKNCDCENEKK